MHRQNREATSGKTRGVFVCLFVNNSLCVMSNIKEVLRYRSTEVEYLMISCRPYYLPREFSSILFVAVYLPPQTDAGTKTALNQLYMAISKQENAHPEAALLSAGNFNARKLNSVYLISPSMLHEQQAPNMRRKLSLPLNLTNLISILSS